MKTQRGRAQSGAALDRGCRTRRRLRKHTSEATAESSGLPPAAILSQ